MPHAPLIMPRTKRLIAATAASCLVATSQASAGVACDFYSAAGFAGQKATLYSGHALVAVDGNAPFFAGIAGAADYQRFSDPRWKGKVGSVRVQPGCKALFSDGTATKIYHTADAHLSGVASAAVAFACSCG